MSITLLSILIGIVTAQLAVLIIYHQNAEEKLRHLKYRYGLEALKLQKRIQALQQSILSYHDKIDKTNQQIHDFHGKDS